MDNENQYLEEKEKADKSRLRAKRIFIGVIVLLLIIIASGGFGGYRMHQKYLNEEVKKKDSIQEQLDQRDIFYELNKQEAIDSVKRLNPKEDEYKGKFIYYFNKSESLQKQLDFIHSLDIDNERLESLARNARYY